jgi:short-subunit dehydrogenase
LAFLFQKPITLYALITGASKGIGKAIAIKLAAEKHNVLLIARSENLLKKLATELADQFSISVYYLAVDLAKPDAAHIVYNWCIQKNYPVNILINNAGYGLNGLLDAYSLEEHFANMQVNMQVPVALTYLFLPQLKKQPSYILNICSGAAYQSVPGLNIYAASKAFLLSFSRGLRYELKNSSVSVTAVCPGATDTDFPNRANITNANAKKLATIFNMSAEEVAVIALNAMFNCKAEIVTGFINKISACLAWLLPKSVSEKSAAGIYGLK